MIPQIFILIFSIGVLLLGAEGLVRGSASLAIRLGLTPLVVGLTVVAFGTSAPELVVSVNASLADQGGLAIGNIVGSNILNIGVILGLTALICPIRIALPVLKVDAPIMVAATIVGALLLSRGTLGSGGGWALISALLLYTGITVWLAKTTSPPEVEAEFEAGVPPVSGSLLRDLGFMSGGLALLVLASHWLVGSATFIATGLGVSEAVIGLTIVAAGTSMPELATSVMAAVRRQPDIAIGNVIGSNIFNVLGILGVAAVVRPIEDTGISVLDLAVMGAFAVALLPLMWTGRNLQRWEGGVLLAGFGVYLYVLWPS